MTSPRQTSVEEHVADDETPAADVLTPEEAWEVFDRVARRDLHMSGEDFLRKWDAGEFGDDPDEAGTVEVVMLLPLVR